MALAVNNTLLESPVLVPLAVMSLFKEGEDREGVEWGRGRGGVELTKGVELTAYPMVLHKLWSPTQIFVLCLLNSGHRSK